MYIVAGLGNPGREYNMTRHNIGFEVIDYIADKHNVRVNKLKYKSVYGEMNIGGEKVFLVKPQTYMNLSGDSLYDFVHFYKVPIENLIVINDDISLDPGRIRVRAKGSAGGHNGLKSIIYMLQSDEFPRVKMGVGAPPVKEYDLADYVLGRFKPEERKELSSKLDNAAEAIKAFCLSGASFAMNHFNK